MCEHFKPASMKIVSYKHSKRYTDMTYSILKNLECCMCTKQMNIDVPFEKCYRLERLILRECDRKTVQRCLGSEFPHLKMFHITSNVDSTLEQQKFNQFIANNGQLTDVSISLRPYRFFDYSSLATLKNLEHLQIGRPNATLVTLKNLKNLRSFAILECDQWCYLDSMLKESASIRASLEAIELTCKHIDFDDLLLLNQASNLCVLKLNIASNVDYEKMRSVLEVFITRSPRIEIIDIECVMGAEFQRKDYRRIDAICRRRNIQLQIHGMYIFDCFDDKDAVVRSFDHSKRQMLYHELHAIVYGIHVYAYFGSSGTGI